ncbi:MAG TPA: hypothetical protein VGO81_03820 [Solirubrobacteraceae bacterium]|jgi:hypothetical protein|nr:hypothetical protein [Solirubrobacteraceae bacterium]
MSIASSCRTQACAAASLAALAVAAPVAPAAADGLPLPVEDSPSGVRAPDGANRYLSVALAGRTAVLAQRTAGGAITSRADLRGRFTIPLVAYDSSAGGISGDGRTLVLIRPRKGFPRHETTLAVMSVRPWLRLRRIVRLRGDFSYDALSPDGRSLFLINYTAPRDPTKYRVRVYDLARGRLDPAPVVDPRESPDAMSGFPVTRAVSRDGRWAYTLYARPNGTPFVHALDTRDRAAVCIDLDGRAFARGDAYGLRLALAAGGARLDVRRKGRPVATVDTATFRVRAADAPRAVARTRGGSGMPWPAPAGAAVLAVALVAGVLSRRRGRARSQPPQDRRPSADPPERVDRAFVDAH